MKERSSDQKRIQKELDPERSDAAYEGILVELRRLREQVSGFPTITQIAAVYLITTELGWMIVAFLDSERHSAERQAERDAHVALQEDRLYEAVERLDRALAEFD